MSAPGSKPFPIPVVPFGPGSQAEDDALDYLDMPKGMHTYRAPVLPQPEEIAHLGGAQLALRRVATALQQALQGTQPMPVDLMGLGEAERQLINQVLGEGEVSAKVDGEPGITVQESVFAGVWRVIGTHQGRLTSDRIEVGRIPACLLDAARADAPLPARGQRLALAPDPAAPLPEGVMNAPSVLAEIEDHARGWRVAKPAHVLNFSLLPLSPADVGLIGERLGEGRVVILSRGYGNCRIADTRVPACWRVTYYNSQDAVILDTVEITDVPEAACAAAEDLQDSHERLLEVLEWIEPPTMQP